MSGFVMKIHCTCNAFNQATYETYLKIFTNAQNKSQLSDLSEISSLWHNCVCFPTLCRMLWWAVSRGLSVTNWSHSVVNSLLLIYSWRLGECTFVCLHGNLGWCLSKYNHMHFVQDQVHVVDVIPLYIAITNMAESESSIASSTKVEELVPKREATMIAWKWFVTKHQMYSKLQ